jgi:hypothetical protein
MEDDEFEKAHIQMLAADTTLPSTKSPPPASSPPPAATAAPAPATAAPAPATAAATAAEKHEKDKEDNDDL